MLQLEKLHEVFGDGVIVTSVGFNLKPVLVEMVPVEKARSKETSESLSDHLGLKHWIFRCQILWLKSSHN